MELRQFDFELPPSQIAQNPASPRDQARLLVYDRRTDTITHSTVADIGRFLPKGTALVANNSKVRRSRLQGFAQGKEIEVLVLEPAGTAQYRCLIRGRNIHAGTEITFPTIPLLHGATVHAVEESPGINTFLIAFHSDTDLEGIFEQFGTMPLPPYITHSTAAPEEYQTVYARELGSAAAPTAGLHFTPELINRLTTEGHAWYEVTLHVGLGTFLPLRNNTLEENVLHKETTYIAPDTAQALNDLKDEHQTILAVGTTSTRTLESHTTNGRLVSGHLDTDLFIYPGYAYQTVSALLTNFHLPKSSLLTLVAAFIGNDPTSHMVVLTEDEMISRLQRVYAEAISSGYRFYSFGDAMLIL